MGTSLLGFIICISILSSNYICIEGNDSSEEPEQHKHYILTTSGRLEACKITSPWGGILRFYGIPYAEPPTGELRFKPSVPKIDTTSLLTKGDIQINTQAATCMQPQHLPEFSHSSLPLGGVNTNEDCLTMDIYMPDDVKNDEKLQIILWVPGDGFNFADSNQYDGSAMASLGRVIVAVANYRVGVLGFASNNSKVAPGNAGAHDIISALKWLTTNGPSFNGSIKDITLAGRFTGSVIISALLTSPLFLQDGDIAKPLATRLIFHGGVAADTYVVERNPSPSFENLLGATDCTIHYTTEIEKCIEALYTKHFLEKAERVHQTWRLSRDNDLLVGDPLERIEFGHIPKGVQIMIGENSGSGSICHTTHSYHKTKILTKLEENTLNEEDLVSLLQGSLKEYFHEDSEGFAAVVAHEYMFGVGDRDTSFRSTYLRFCSTLFTRNPSELYARYLSRFNVPVYRYEFAYRASTSQQPKYLDAAAGEEIIFLFPSNQTKMSKQDESVFHSFIGSWTNFAKTGNPSLEENWSLFDEEFKKMVIFTENGLKESTTEFLDREIHFWRSAVAPLIGTFHTGSRSTLKELQQCVAEKSNVTQNVYEEYSETTHALALFVVALGVIFGIIILVFLVRNWDKPYLWKFT